MTTIHGDYHYPQAHREHIAKSEPHQSPRHHGPSVPDLRFEYSYLRSIRPLVHVERVTPPTDEKGKGKEKAVEDDEEGSQVVKLEETVTVDWGRLVWVTTRDQVLSPFIQGAAWCVLPRSPLFNLSNHTLYLFYLP